MTLKSSPTVLLLSLTFAYVNTRQGNAKMQVPAHLCAQYFFLHYPFIAITTEATTENVLLGSIEMPKPLANLTRDTTTQRNTTCPSSLLQQIKLRKAREFKMPNNYSNSLCLYSNFHIANSFHCWESIIHNHRKLECKST